jgi:GH24 family phage-related lysozyme (muramidase)
MIVSRNGMLAACCREALVLVAYPDPTPTQCSAGFGQQVPHMRPGDPVTIEWAFSTMKVSAAKRAAELSRRLKVSLEQHQFDALWSLYYQSGVRYMPIKPRLPGEVHSDYPDILALINAGRLDEAADLWPACDANQAGEHMGGLRKRRLLEQAIWVHADYGDLSTIPMWRGNPRTTKRETYVVQPEDLA